MGNRLQSGFEVRNQWLEKGADFIEKEREALLKKMTQNEMDIANKVAERKTMADFGVAHNYWSEDGPGADVMRGRKPSERELAALHSQQTEELPSGWDQTMNQMNQWGDQASQMASQVGEGIQRDIRSTAPEPMPPKYDMADVGQMVHNPEHRPTRLHNISPRMRGLKNVARELSGTVSEDLANVGWPEIGAGIGAGIGAAQAIIPEEFDDGLINIGAGVPFKRLDQVFRNRKLKDISNKELRLTLRESMNGFTRGEMDLLDDMKKADSTVGEFALAVGGIREKVAKTGLSEQKIIDGMKKTESMSSKEKIAKWVKDGPPYRVGRRWYGGPQPTGKDTNVATMSYIDEIKGPPPITARPKPGSGGQGPKQYSQEGELSNYSAEEIGRPFDEAGNFVDEAIDEKRWINQIQTAKEKFGEKEVDKIVDGLEAQNYSQYDILEVFKAKQQKKGKKLGGGRPDLHKGIRSDSDSMAGVYREMEGLGVPMDEANIAYAKKLIDGGYDDVDAAQAISNRIDGTDFAEVKSKLVDHFRAKDTDELNKFINSRFENMDSVDDVVVDKIYSRLEKQIPLLKQKGLSDEEIVETLNNADVPITNKVRELIEGKVKIAAKKEPLFRKTKPEPVFSKDRRNSLDELINSVDDDASEAAKEAAGDLRKAVDSDNARAADHAEDRLVNELEADAERTYHSVINNEDYPTAVHVDDVAKEEAKGVGRTSKKPKWKKDDPKAQLKTETQKRPKWAGETKDYEDQVRSGKKIWERDYFDVEEQHPLIYAAREKIKQLEDGQIRVGMEYDDVGKSAEKSFKREVDDIKKAAESGDMEQLDLALFELDDAFNQGRHEYDFISSEAADKLKRFKNNYAVTDAVEDKVGNLTKVKFGKENQNNMWEISSKSAPPKGLSTTGKIEHIQRNQRNKDADKLRAAFEKQNAKSTDSVKEDIALRKQRAKRDKKNKIASEEIRDLYEKRKKYAEIMKSKKKKVQEFGEEGMDALLNELKTLPGAGKKETEAILNGVKKNKTIKDIWDDVMFIYKRDTPF